MPCVSKASNNMHELTDIICLVHNQLPVTKGFVERLFKHTENFRLIFVDNGSNDGTAEFLAEGGKSNRWKVISPGRNLGVIEGRNLGAKQVKSNYFVNLDNDQYVNDGWLDNLFLLMDKGFDIVGSEAWMMYPPGSGGAVVAGNVTHGRAYYPFRRCTSKKEKFTYIGCGGMLIKTSLYKSIGLFDERFSPAYFEDPDLCFRAIQAGYKLGWSHDCSIEHLAHQTINNQSLFQKSPQFIKSWKAFIEKWNPYFPKPILM